ncbi:MAG: hypothetical protein J0I40_00050 [Cellulomonas sp.]|nr:hypothetical protein [Cellulomonas sp.]
MLSLLQAADRTNTAGTPQLVVAAVVAIAAIVLLIVWLKLHPFLSLTVGAGLMAVVAAVPFGKAFASFTTGLGSTVGSTGVLIALGAIIGTLLVRSGGADEVVDSILAKTPAKRLPWALALAAFVIGIPLFFEVGVVLLIPVVMLAARRAKLPVVLLGIPALAGLSALHGLVPPHPGPLIAISALNANLGTTLGLGLLVAIPTVAISGPLLARTMAKWVPIQAPALLGDATVVEGRKRPRFSVALLVVLLPVILMLLAAGLSPTHVALMVLAIGAGSVFLSHVNDAGFWLVKEYFGMTVGQTFKTWSLMESVLSVVGLAFVMLLGLVV